MPDGAWLKGSDGRVMPTGGRTFGCAQDDGFGGAGGDDFACSTAPRAGLCSRFGWLGRGWCVLSGWKDGASRASERLASGAEARILGWPERPEPEGSGYLEGLLYEEALGVGGREFVVALRLRWLVVAVVGPGSVCWGCGVCPCADCCCGEREAAWLGGSRGRGRGGKVKQVSPLRSR